MKVKMPKYVQGFKCIAGACEDSCCKDWAVDIDYETYKRYQQVQDPQMKKHLKRYVYKNPEVHDFEIDYGKIELTADRQCSFLNSEGLCLIQKHLGEPLLSNVCKLFPRTYNLIDGHLELSLSTSCPEAARRMLLMPDAMQMIETDISDFPPIITYTVDTRARQYRGSHVRFLNAIRSQLIEILSCESSTLDDSFWMIGNWLYQIDQLQKKNKLSALPPTSVRQGISNEMFSKWLEESGDLLKPLLNRSQVDSKRYLEFSRVAAVKTGLQEGGEMIEDAYSKQIRHYFINLIFRNLLPFSETDTIWDGGLLILARYALIRQQVQAFQEADDVTVASYLQAFSKVVEHHHTFPFQALEVLKGGPDLFRDLFHK